MFGWQRSVGVVLGLCVGFAVLYLTGGARKAPALTGSILSESEGALCELVIHYESGAKSIVSETYREFLSALEADVTVHVVCPDSSAYADMRSWLGKTKCQLRPIIVGHPITTWSRDRWVALQPADMNEPTTLYVPRGEAAEEIWPARAGDERVGNDLAAALTPAVRVRRSGLYFDGGDFLADSRNVFVMPRVLQRNIQHTVTDREPLLESLRLELKRRVVLLKEAPDHHAGMFMASVGDNVMLVGDPKLGKEWAESPEASASGFMNLPGGPDFSAATQGLFDSVAAQCAAEGYQVIRIPTVPACDGRTYLTYLNVLLEAKGQQRIVYLPFYRGAESLNAAAQKVWSDLGYEIRPVDCTAVYPHSGCLHCLVNVLKRT